MFELIYHSQSCNELSNNDLQEILKVARTVNQKLCITGMLVYSDQHFFQLLEGDQSSVELLYEKIFNDKRHQFVSKLYQGNIKHRSFDEWSMAFKKFTALDNDVFTQAGFINIENGFDSNIQASESSNIARRLFSILSRQVSPQTN